MSVENEKFIIRSVEFAETKGLSSFEMMISVSVKLKANDQIAGIVNIVRITDR